MSLLIFSNIEIEYTRFRTEVSEIEQNSTRLPKLETQFRLVDRNEVSHKVGLKG